MLFLAEPCCPNSTQSGPGLGCPQPARWGEELLWAVNTASLTQLARRP